MPRVHAKICTPLDGDCYAQEVRPGRWGFAACCDGLSPCREQRKRRDPLAQQYGTDLWICRHRCPSPPPPPAPPPSPPSPPRPPPEPPGTRRRCSLELEDPFSFDFGDATFGEAPCCEPLVACLEKRPPTDSAWTIYPNRVTCRTVCVSPPSPPVIKSS